MPAEERDHRDPDRNVEHGVENFGRASGEERQQPDLNGVGNDRDDPRGDDAALRLLHARTLGSASGGGQTSFAREDGSPADGVNAEGKATHSTYSSKFDAKDVPYEGNPNADTAAPKKIDDNSFENVWKKGGNATMTAKVVVSADGKTLTITQTGKNAKGEAVNITAVYEKQ